MIGKPFHLLTSWLLLAAMLVSGNGPPSFCHSHVGGDQAHPHDCTAHHCDDRHAFAHDNDECASHWMEPAVAHVHCLWFGFEFSMPLDSEQEDEDEDQPSSFLALGRSQQIAMVTLGSSGTVLNTQADIASVPFAATAEKQTQRTVAQNLAQPLCAKARHERSGVQLI